MKIITICVLVWIGILAAPLLTPYLFAAEFSAQSPNCGPVTGKTAKDRDNALAFCNQGIVKGAVVGVMAMESLAWIKVSRQIADEMRADRLTTEQLVKTWMTAWKKLSGSKAVTVYVEWENVEIAKGETTLLSGDRVTIK